MLQLHRNLLFPALIAQEKINFKQKDSKSKTSIYKLDWRNIDQFKEEKVSKEYTSEAYCKTLPDNFELSGFHIIDDLSFGITEDNLKTIRHYCYQANNESLKIKSLNLDQNEYGYSKPLDQDSIIKFDSAICPTVSYIRSVFHLLSDCLFDRESQYYSRSTDKIILPYILLYRFWIYQTSEENVINFTNFEHLIKLMENIKDSDSQTYLKGMKCCIEIQDHLDSVKNSIIKSENLIEAKRLENEANKRNRKVIPLKTEPTTDIYRFIDTTFRESSINLGSCSLSLYNIAGKSHVLSPILKDAKIVRTEIDEPDMLYASLLHASIENIDFLKDRADTGETFDFHIYDESNNLLIPFHKATVKKIEVEEIENKFYSCKVEIQIGYITKPAQSKLIENIEKLHEQVDMVIADPDYAIVPNPRSLLDFENSRREANKVKEINPDKIKENIETPNSYYEYDDSNKISYKESEPSRDPKKAISVAAPDLKTFIYTRSSHRNFTVFNLKDQMLNICGVAALSVKNPTLKYDGRDLILTTEFSWEGKVEKCNTLQRIAIEDNIPISFRLTELPLSLDIKLSSNYSDLLVKEAYIEKISSTPPPVITIKIAKFEIKEYAPQAKLSKGLEKNGSIALPNHQTTEDGEIIKTIQINRDEDHEVKTILNKISEDKDNSQNNSESISDKDITFDFDIKEMDAAIAQTDEMKVKEWENLSDLWPDDGAVDIYVNNNSSIAVEVNGKIITNLILREKVSAEELKKKILKLSQVKKEISGKTIKKVITVPNKLVNIIVDEPEKYTSTFSEVRKIKVDLNKLENCIDGEVKSIMEDKDVHLRIKGKVESMSDILSKTFPVTFNKSPLQSESPDVCSKIITNIFPVDCSEIIKQLKDRSKMKILILDDDQTRLDTFNKKLVGNEVTMVKTAKEAIDALDKESFSVVSLDHDLSDQQMVSSGPGTGYEVAQWLYDHPEKQPETIIIHSYNPVGAQNMAALLPKAKVIPGIWMML